MYTCIHVNIVYAFRSLKRCCVPQHCGEMSMKWHSLYTLKSYFKCIKLCNILLFSPSCCTNVFFTAPAVLLKFTFLCIGIFIGILPETRYFLLAFYRYFRENLDSVTFLGPWWQPWVFTPEQWQKHWVPSYWPEERSYWHSKEAGGQGGVRELDAKYCHPCAKRNFKTPWSHFGSLQRFGNQNCGPSHLNCSDG